MSRKYFISSVGAVAVAYRHRHFALPLMHDGVDTPATITFYDEKTHTGRLRFYGGAEMRFSCHGADMMTGTTIEVEGLVPDPMPFDRQSISVGKVFEVVSFPQLSEAWNEQLCVELVAKDNTRIWAAVTKVSPIEITFVVRGVTGEFTCHAAVSRRTNDYTIVTVTETY